MYSGFEHYEATPREPGSEEYLDSEKYELKQRALDGPLLPLLARLNEIRRAHPALARFEALRFLETESESLLGYARRDGEDVLLVVVTLDPRRPQEGVLDRPARARPAGELRRQRPARRRALRLAARAQLRAPRPGAHRRARAGGGRVSDARRSAGRDPPRRRSRRPPTARRAGAARAPATRARRADARAAAPRARRARSRRRGRRRAVVRVQPAVVQVRDLLRDPRARVLRRATPTARATSAG